MFGVGAFGDDRGAMLEAPPQQCLSFGLAVLSCNAGNCPVLHCMPFLLQLDWSPWMVSSNAVRFHEDMHCCMSFALLHVICTFACLMSLQMQQTQTGVLACTLTGLNNNVIAKMPGRTENA